MSTAIMWTLVGKEQETHQKGLNINSVLLTDHNAVFVDTTSDYPCLHNPQLGGRFGGIGHRGGFFGPRTVPLCYPICKGTQKTLTFFQLLFLVKCRSVSI